MTDDRAHLRALSRVRRTYRLWGRRPALYAAQDWLTFLGRPGVIRRRAVAAQALRPGDRVLEIGCGTGRNLPYLVPAVGPTGAVVGCERFDGVLAVLALSAIPRWEDALRRCRDVLAPGGALLVCDAQPFPGRLRVLNPVVRALYRRGAAWSPDRDVVAGLRRVFGHVAVERLDAGSFYIATARLGHANEAAG